MRSLLLSLVGLGLYVESMAVDFTIPFCVASCLDEGRHFEFCLNVCQPSTAQFSNPLESLICQFRCNNLKYVDCPELCEGYCMQGCKKGNDGDSVEICLNHCSHLDDSVKYLDWMRDYFKDE
mmetsp:Transcript_50560/g.57977  ORF Transcript_50560/g.57977 Transcript_50560/m.57977 type:complete len:122 (-) Transcript_50560:223-588(-)